MQCAGSRMARSLLRTFSNRKTFCELLLEPRTFPGSASRNRLSHSVFSSQNGRSISNTKSSIRGFAKQALAITPPRISFLNCVKLLENADEEGKTLLGMVPSMTRAQVARAGAQAVRLAVQDGEILNASFLVHSFQCSTLLPPNHNSFPVSSRSGTPDVSIKSKYPPPILFGKPISPRLPGHALLHGLVRRGDFVEASKYARELLDNGIDIKDSTLLAITRPLIFQRPSNFKPFSEPSGPLPKSMKDLQKMRPWFVSDPLTRRALRLFAQARSVRKERCHELYQSLISACLLQGEILVGTALFVLAIKDWQLRRERASLVANSAPPTEERQLKAQFDAMALVEQNRLHALLNPILLRIDDVLAQDPHHKAEWFQFDCALQALTKVAALLEERKLGLPSISKLVHSIYSCPHSSRTVRVKRDGRTVELNGHSYLHSVLNGLISSKLPFYDASTYNALLHYALRHRLSSRMASHVLEEMMVKRQPPLEPNTTTYNIILRAGTLLRRTDISDVVLNLLKIPPPNLPRSPTPTPKLLRGPIAAELVRSEGDAFKLPIKGPLQCHNRLPADAFTMSSYLLHLTSTGNPTAVANMVPIFLPEISIIDHPAGTPTALRLTRSESLERAIEYGPYFYASLLNALRKAGKVGMAERVWHLAKEAERASWVNGPDGGIKPWCLSIHAYTSMIQCYANEARKSMLVRAQATPGVTRQHHQHSWVPRNKRFVVGWAKFVLTKQMGGYQASRSAMGRKLGLALCREMLSGANAVIKSLPTVANHPSGRNTTSLRTPIPDERFFNAVLDIFGRNHEMASRRARGRRSHYKRVFNNAYRRFAQTGTISRHWTPQLQEIAEEMGKRGFTIPPALRHLFIGKSRSGIKTHGRRKRCIRRPFAFGYVRSKTFQPYRMQTVKTRGLPVRRVHRSKSDSKRP